MLDLLLPQCRVSSGAGHAGRSRSHPAADAIWAKAQLLHRANPDPNGATYTAMRTDGTVVPNHPDQGEAYVYLGKAAQTVREGAYGRFEAVGKEGGREAPASRTASTASRTASTASRASRLRHLLGLGLRPLHRPGETKSCAIWPRSKPPLTSPILRPRTICIR